MTHQGMGETMSEKSKSKPDSERVIGKPDPDTIAYYKKMRRLDAEFSRKSSLDK